MGAREPGPITGRATGRATLLLMIPLNLLLCAWVWIGRIFFGVGGWFILILMPVALLLLVGLAVTTVLGLTQADRPRHLSQAQARAQWATWTAMFGWGLLMPDFGDTEDSSASSLTRVFGYSDDLLDFSFLAAVVLAVLTLVAYVVLLVTLIAGRQRVAAARKPIAM